MEAKTGGKNAEGNNLTADSEHEDPAGIAADITYC